VTTADGSHPFREVRATTAGSNLIVYQAYRADIADAALTAGTFVSPFRRGRMTWIKPSFLWMAYRSGWGRKPDQERVLAVHITRAGFEWALDHACLSDYEAAVHGSHDDWRAALASSPVRVQWDPERDLRFAALDHRAIQIGLRGEAVDRYLDEWIVAIDDVTGLMHEVEALMVGDPDGALKKLPHEEPIPVGPDLVRRLGMNHGHG
jgi:hypothetical protein